MWNKFVKLPWRWKLPILVKSLDVAGLAGALVLHGGWKTGVATWFVAHEGYYRVFAKVFGDEWLNDLSGWVGVLWTGDPEDFYGRVLLTMLLFGLLWPPIISFGAGWLLDFLYEKKDGLT